MSQTVFSTTDVARVVNASWTTETCEKCRWADAVRVSRGEFVFMFIETDSLWECKLVPNGFIAMLTYLLTYLPLKGLSLARSKARNCHIAGVPICD